jgi:hypothetical protein
MKGTVGLERPGSVDGIRPLDDVGADAARAVELRELDHLLELLASRWLGALAHPAAKARRTVREQLDRRLRRLPLGHLRRVGEVVEDGVGGTGTVNVWSILIGDQPY